MLNLMVLGLVLAIPLTGCKHKPTPLTPLPPGAHPVPAEPPPGGMIGEKPPPITETPTGFPTSPRGGHAGWTENRDVFKAQTVYFDFDSAVVKTGEKPKLDVVAAHLQSNPAQAVKIEGHCDERGTEEYNRALGDRRALALREQLIAAGIGPERVDTISYGEDRPVDPGHNEAAWRKNRRGEFILLTPP